MISAASFPGRRTAGPGVALFLAMMAAQAGLLVLTPALPAIASDFELSTAAVGQLRTASGLAGALSAIAVMLLSSRLDIRRLLLAGLALLTAGSLASAAAPDFAALATSQLAVGTGVGLLASGAIAAAAEWSTDSSRARLLSVALLGQPAAWLAGMPLAGALAESSWRLTLLVVPPVAAALAGLAVRAQPRGARRRPAVPARLWRSREVRTWALGELLAYSAWAGTLIYVGALLADSYGTSAASIGLLLAAGATAYVPGNLLARRWVKREPRALLSSLALIAAAAALALGAVRPGTWLTGALFIGLAFLNGSRTLAGSALGLNAASAHRLAAMGARTAALQLGYLLGAAIGGAAIGIAGYSGLGLAIGSLFALAAVPHLALLRRRRPRRHGLRARLALAR